MKIYQEYEIVFRGPQGTWEPYFTWLPHRINRRWYWLTGVYRRVKNKYVLPHQGYEYGDAFDILRQ